MKKLDDVKWQKTCCEWHGDYAEANTADGGVMRIKRGQSVDGYLVMRFDAHNQRMDDDYVRLSEDDVEALLK